MYRVKILTSKGSFNIQDNSNGGIRVSADRESTLRRVFGEMAVIESGPKNGPRFFADVGQGVIGPIIERLCR